MDANAIDLSKIDLSTIDPRLVREMLIMNEIFKLHPPMTRAKGLARRRADRELQAKYPGRYVAYVDVWSDDELDRKVVTTATEVGEFHDELAKLTSDVRERIAMTRVPDPDGGIFAGGSGLV